MKLPDEILTDSVKTEIVGHALSYPDEEVCGFVLRDGTVHWAKNLAEDRRNNFLISRQAFAVARKKSGGIAAVYHSHPGDEHSELFTFADIAASQRARIPYILYHTKFSSWDYYDADLPCPYPLQRPGGDPKDLSFYKGWPWVKLRSDCYALFRSIYKHILDIELPLIELEEDSREVARPGWNKYEEGLLASGFTRLSRDAVLRKWDVPLMCFFGNNPHHSGIITNPAEMLFLHHDIPPFLSREELFNNYWMEAASKGGIWRHPTVEARRIKEEENLWH